MRKKRCKHVKPDQRKGRRNGSLENCKGGTANGKLQRGKGADDNRWE